MGIHYLLDAEVTREGVKLSFYNPSTGTIDEMLDTGYRPYFFIPHPLSQEDEETIRILDFNIHTVEKRDLFTGQMRKVTRLEIEDVSDPKRSSESFRKAWEGEVPLILGYVYDHGLTFGAQHQIQGTQTKIVFEVSEEARHRFEERFSEVKKVDPDKYYLLERWFALCSQPVPEIIPEKLGIGGRVDPERYYLAFILSRLANLPVPTAYNSQRVSVWIKSILHNYLRSNNILIPTNRELRSGEIKRSVRGALTLPPETGVHFNTVVTDFESLYPSLIDAYNLSYETVDCPHPECRDNTVPELKHHVCTRRRGVYSILIGSIKDLRIHWFKLLSRDKTIPAKERRLAQATSKLLKLILVSSYGVTVRIHNLACPSLAESITAYGRHSLKTAWETAKEGGLHPIYGDTDSIFLDDPSEEQVKWLIKTVKERLRLDLAVNEQYAVCILPRAMKAYFGIRRNGTPDIKGVTAIKSNSPTFIKNVFRNGVKEMADVKNQADFEEAKQRIQQIVRDAIADLKKGNMPLKNFEYSVRLHEDPQEKVDEATIHQPYQCAVQLIDSGKTVRRGDTVNFMKTKPFRYRGKTFTVKPTEQVKSFDEINLEDYIRNLRTALNQTFKPMNIRFAEEAKKRITLSDFV